MSKNYMTPHCFKKLTDELDHLSKIERPEVVKTVQWAASLGDRSENADYKYGKKRLREIDKRLRFLSKKIDDSVVIDPASQEGSKIQFGATVFLKDEDGQEKIISIVGIDESDPKSGLVSWISPIAKSMLGKEVGDGINVHAPSGDIEYEIVNFKYKEINFND